MRLKFAIPLAIAAAYLPSVHNAGAVTYAETGDAGELPAFAQIITNPVGYSATSAVLTTAITGTTTATNGLYDSDMYQITILYPSTFTASTNFFVVGANNFDSQISLFTTAGSGLLPTTMPRAAAASRRSRSRWRRALTTCSSAVPAVTGSAPAD